MTTKNIAKVFYTESAMMTKSINRAESDVTIQPSDIVAMYYQVTNVSAMAHTLKDKAQDKNSELYKAICSTERFISEKFDAIVHPHMKRNIAEMIQKVMTDLQLGVQKKTKFEIEAESKKYDSLRSMMSVKEFIKQYDMMIEGTADARRDQD